MKFRDYIDIEQYSLTKEKKNQYFFKLLNDLNGHHVSNSIDHKKISEIYFNKKNEISSTGEIPFLPVSVFKNKLLHSI